MKTKVIKTTVKDVVNNYSSTRKFFRSILLKDQELSECFIETNDNEARILRNESVSNKETLVTKGHVWNV